MRYNGHKTLYKFQVYNEKIQYLYVLQNDHNSKSDWYPSLYIEICFPCDEDLRSTFLRNAFWFTN